MSQYRTGNFVSAGTAVTLALGFVPDRVRVVNYTALATDATAVFQSEYFKNVVPSGYAVQFSKTITTGAVTQADITSNGFTPVILGGDWQSTQYVITGFVPATGVVTVSSISPTNTLTLVNGMTVTFSGVKGSVQLNTNRYIVTNISGSTFKLSDLFGNPVDTTGFGTYVSGGIVNQISYPPIAPTIDPITGQITTQGQPAGNQYDIGYQGIILGTGVVGSSTNVMWWEAITQTPTGW